MDCLLPAAAAPYLKDVQDSFAAALSMEDVLLTSGGHKNALMAMFACLNPGSRLLLPRTACPDAFSAALCSDITVIVGPTVIPHTQESFRDLLSCSHADAVLITTPDIRGTLTDLAPLAAAAHENGTLLLVDASLGTALALTDGGSHGYPLADLVCFDLSASLGAMAQCHAVARNGEFVPQERFFFSAERFFILTASSAASCSWALFSLKRQDMDVFSRRRSSLVANLRGIPGISVCTGGAVSPFQLTISFSERGISGYAAYAALWEKGISCLHADSLSIMLLLSPYDQPAWDEALLCALATLPFRMEASAPAAVPLPERASPEIHVSGAASLLSFDEAQGLSVAFPIGDHPLNCTLLVPGDILSQASAKYLSSACEDFPEPVGIFEKRILAMKEVCS